MLADTLFAILAGQIFVIVPIVRHEMVPVQDTLVLFWNTVQAFLDLFGILVQSVLGLSTCIYAQLQHHVDGVNNSFRVNCGHLGGSESATGSFGLRLIISRLSDGFSRLLRRPPPEQVQEEDDIRAGSSSAVEEGA